MIVLWIATAALQPTPLPSPPLSPGPTVIELIPASPSELAVPHMFFFCVDLQKQPRARFRIDVQNDKKTSKFEVFRNDGAELQSVFSSSISELAFSDADKHMMLKVVAAGTDSTSRAELLIRIQPDYKTADFKLTTSSAEYAGRCSEPPPPPRIRRPERGQ